MSGPKVKSGICGRDLVYLVVSYYTNWQK